MNKIKASIGSGIARLILELLGWSSRVTYGSKQYKTINEPLSFLPHKRVVFLYTHSSYWDFFFFLLYYIALGGSSSGVTTLVKPQAYYLFPSFLSKVGCIPSARLQDKGSGRATEIIRDLKKKNQFVLLICPKGSRDHRCWRKGWKAIATETKAMVVVGGLNYKDKSLLIQSVHTMEDLEPSSSADPQLTLESNMFKVHPLYPQYGHGYNLSDQEPIDRYFFFLLLAVAAIWTWPHLIYSWVIVMANKPFRNRSSLLQDLVFTIAICFIHYIRV